MVDQNYIRKLITGPQKALTEFRVSRLKEEVRGVVIKEVKNAFSPNHLTINNSSCRILCGRALLCVYGVAA